jgi:ectoine hydroxylase-related dioxygenase (phytanoyl-CoA dioxygenase family)
MSSKSQPKDGKDGGVGQDSSSVASTLLLKRLEKLFYPHGWIGTAVFEYAVSHDESYAKNFALAEIQDIRKFFALHGYVIIRDVLSHDECWQTRQEFEASIGALSPTKPTKQKFMLQNEKTHDVTCFNNYGMWSGPMITSNLLRNRQNPRLIEAFRILYDTKASDLLINHDSGCFYRPTHTHEHYKTQSQYPDLHVDFHPGGYQQPQPVIEKRDALRYTTQSDWMLENNLLIREDGLQLAGVINLYPNRREDGGFHCAAGFRSTSFEPWLESQSKKFKQSREQIGSYYFDARDKNDIKYLTRHEFVRASAPTGALIIWDQLTAHGSRPNESDRFRCAQFVKMFRKSTFSPQRLEARKKALQRHFQLLKFQPSKLGRLIFGLDF